MQECADFPLPEEAVEEGELEVPPVPPSGGPSPGAGGPAQSPAGTPAGAGGGGARAGEEVGAGGAGEGEGQAGAGRVEAGGAGGPVLSPAGRPRPQLLYPGAQAEQECGGKHGSPEGCKCSTGNCTIHYLHGCL